MDFIIVLPNQETTIVAIIHTLLSSTYQFQWASVRRIPQVHLVREGGRKQALAVRAPVDVVRVKVREDARSVEDLTGAS